MPEIYVKKLVSLSPDKYEYRLLSWAIDRYAVYVNDCAQSAYPNVRQSVKSFQQWLATEI